MYPLRDFPGREAAALGGAFRDNVRWLLKQWGPAADGIGSSAWRALLSNDRTGAIVPILAVEELAASSPAPLCDYCRCAGTVPFLTSLPSSPLENDWNGRASITLPTPAAAFVPTPPLQGLGLPLLRLHAYMISKKKYIYTIDDDCFLWLMAAQFEIRQKNLKATRQILGNAIGMAPKGKRFKKCIEIELYLGNQPALDTSEVLWKDKANGQNEE